MPRGGYDAVGLHPGDYGGALVCNAAGYTHRGRTKRAGVCQPRERQRRQYRNLATGDELIWRRCSHPASIGQTQWLQKLERRTLQ